MKTQLKPENLMELFL